MDKYVCCNSLQYFVYFYRVSWLKLCHAHAQNFYWYSGPDPRSLVKVTGVELVNDEVVLVTIDS